MGEAARGQVKPEGPDCRKIAEAAVRLRFPEEFDDFTKEDWALLEDVGQRCALEALRLTDPKLWERRA